MDWEELWLLSSKDAVWGHENRVETFYGRKTHLSSIKIVLRHIYVVGENVNTANKQVGWGIDQIPEMPSARYRPSCAQQQV